MPRPNIKRDAYFLGNVLLIDRFTMSYLKFLKNTQKNLFFETIFIANTKCTNKNEKSTKFLF